MVVEGGFALESGATLALPSSSYHPGVLLAKVLEKKGQAHSLFQLLTEVERASKLCRFPVPVNFWHTS